MRKHYLPILSSIRLNQPSQGHSFTLWNITFSPLSPLSLLRYHGSRYKKIFFSSPLFDSPPPRKSPYWFSHMFWVQREKLTYHEVLTVKGLHWDTEYRNTLMGNFYRLTTVNCNAICSLMSAFYIMTPSHMLLVITFSCTNYIFF